MSQNDFSLDLGLRRNAMRCVMVTRSRFHTTTLLLGARCCFLLN